MVLSLPFDAMPCHCYIIAGYHPTLLALTEFEKSFSHYLALLTTLFVLLFFSVFHAICIT